MGCHFLLQGIELAFPVSLALAGRFLTTEAPERPCLDDLPMVICPVSGRARIVHNKKAKWLWGGLTNSCEKKRSEKQRTKGKIKASECRVPKNSKER